MNDCDITWILVEGLEVPFYISSTPVTCDQYEKFCEANVYEMPEAPYGRGKMPVMGVDVVDVDSFCEWLSKETNTVVRRPEKDEWLYSAGGGNKGKGYKYSGSDNFNEVGAILPHEVATMLANELGIYDMHGNVREWCKRGNEPLSQIEKIFESYVPVLGGCKSLDGLSCGCGKGGTWVCSERQCIMAGPYERAAGYGFRVVREWVPSI